MDFYTLGDYTIIVKKRVRKKKKLGEFVEWGVLIQAPLSLKSRDELDSFLDEFIVAVESRNCYCGGGVSIERGLDMVLELGRGRGRAIKTFAVILDWLNTNPGVGKVYSSDVFDLWRGKYPQDLQDL